MLHFFSLNKNVNQNSTNFKLKILKLKILIRQKLFKIIITDKSELIFADFFAEGKKKPRIGLLKKTFNNF